MARAAEPPRVEPEALAYDAAGRPFSSRYGDVYASRDGALGQARHVFLGGNTLPQAWSGRRQFVILETGFGLGTNFLAAWQAWREDPQRPARLHFVSIEAHPLNASDLRNAHAGDGLQALRDRLADQWPLLVAGLHCIEFEAGGVVLTLALGEAQAIAPRLRLGADAFFLDGFAPERNPAMWSPDLIRQLARLARPGATVATWCCARAVRDALQAHGFAVETAPGFGGKREMLRARYQPAWRMRRHEPPAPRSGERHAIVIGAGLAGSACAAALARRGWRVCVLEAGAHVAAGASALPSGVLAPLLSADDNLVSRLVRAGFLHSLRALHRIDPDGSTPDRPSQGAAWAPCGVFRQAPDAAFEEGLAARLGARAWPEAFAAFRTSAEAGDRLGVPPRRGGTWFELGAVVSAARFCERLLHAPASGKVELHLQTPVRRLSHEEQGWEAHDAAGRSHAAPVVVLANAGALGELQALEGARLEAIGGRVTLLAPGALGGLRAAVDGDGFVVPGLLGAAAVGATYEFAAEFAVKFAADRAAGGVRAGIEGEVAPGPTLDAAQAQAANMERLNRLLALAPGAIAVAGSFAGLRAVAPDRLPLAGGFVDAQAALAVPRGAERLRGAQLADLPRIDGVYCLAGLGSRGLALAPLLAEHLASLIEGEPTPLESDLAAAVDPARFFLRGRR